MTTPEHSLKYRAVYAFLKEGMVRGEFPYGSRLPTESELMKRLGVSRPTVIRAFRDLENEGMVERRRGSGSYVRPPVSNAPRRLFGLMISGLFVTGSIDHSIFAALTGALAGCAREHNASIIFSGVLSEQEPERMIGHAQEMAREYIAQDAAGVFFVPLLLPEEKMSVNRDIAQLFEKRGIPLVLIDRDLYPSAQRSRFDLAALDHRQAGYLLTMHLLDQGCERIDFVMGANAASSIQARVAGWREALCERGIAPGSDWLHREREFDKTTADQLAAACSAADGVICYNDDVAVFLGQALERKGVRVPKELKLAGFDRAPVGRQLPYELTTMEQPVQLIGRGAMELMLQRLKTPTAPAQTRLYAPALVTGRSSEKP